MSVIRPKQFVTKVTDAEYERGKTAARDMLAALTGDEKPEDFERMRDANETVSQRNPAWARGFNEVLSAYEDKHT